VGYDPPRKRRRWSQYGLDAGTAKGGARDEQRAASSSKTPTTTVPASGSSRPDAFADGTVRCTATALMLFERERSALDAVIPALHLDGLDDVRAGLSAVQPAGN